MDCVLSLTPNSRRNKAQDMVAFHLFYLTPGNSIRFSVNSCKEALLICTLSLSLSFNSEVSIRYTALTEREINFLAFFL